MERLKKKLLTREGLTNRWASGEKVKFPVCKVHKVDKSHWYYQRRGKRGQLLKDRTFYRIFNIL